MEFSAVTEFSAVKQFPSGHLGERYLLRMKKAGQIVRLSLLQGNP
jgi:hypothetical protein